MTKNRDEEQRKNRFEKEEWRTKNPGALSGRLNVGWAIRRFGLQICTKKNVGSEEHKEEEGKLNVETRVLKTRVPRGFFSTSDATTYKSRFRNSSFILELEF